MKNKNSDQNKLFRKRIKYSHKNNFIPNANKYAKQSKKQSHPFRHQ